MMTGAARCCRACRGILAAFTRLREGKEIVFKLSVFRFDEALRAFASDIYLCSLMYGCESVRLCSSYFQMGRVLESQRKNDMALPFYRKVVQSYSRWAETFCIRSAGGCFQRFFDNF